MNEMENKIDVFEPVVIAGVKMSNRVLRAATDEGKTFNVNRISENTINRVICDFVDATIRAKKAGFDGVELHLAHGYFLSEMLSAHTNKRRDKWAEM